MLKKFEHPFGVTGVVLFSVFILYLNFKLNPYGYLKFSDSAKFADTARNMITGSGYGGSFTFWVSLVFGQIKLPTFPAIWVPPLMPFSMALVFKIFGVSDFSVIAVSSAYFVLLAVFTFLLGKKLFGNLAGTLSAITVAASIDFINYAANGATEAAFGFEIVASAYFISLRKKWATAVAIVFAVLMYFTRPQAFIYIAGMVLYWVLLNFKIKKALILFIFAIIAGFLIDYLILARVTGRYFLYSVYSRGFGSVTQVSAGGSTSDILRGTAESSAAVGLVQVTKKLFYNLYNFYKLAPQIVNPYLFILFIVGLFKWGKDRLENSLKGTTIFVVGLTLVITALSIPFFRYIHPVVPLVYIFAVGTLVWIITQISRQPKFLIFTTSLLILVFVVGQTLGVIFLDSRFVRNTYNVGKPPVYVQLSYILRDNIDKNKIVVTNLDTWGSWYGERKTVWFPLAPKQLIDPSIAKIPFDAIFLTSYLIDDQNYYMGADWRLIFDNPSDPKKWTCDGCGEIAKEFKLKGIYQVASGENYERQDAAAILLIKK